MSHYYSGFDQLDYVHLVVVIIATKLSTLILWDQEVLYSMGEWSLLSKQLALVP